MKKMKYLLILCLGLTATGCTKDNYDEPESLLTGKIVYDGTPLNVRGTGGAVTIQAYQHGYDYFNPISINVGQDGSFSATLFNGDYLLVTKDGNGPWVNNRDSVAVTVKGNTNIDVSVTPYFMISGENITLAGSKVKASFTIERIVPAARISKVMLLLSKTQFADDISNIYHQEYSDIKTGNVMLEADVADNADVQNAKALFARACVWAEGSDQGIYSSVVRLK